MRNNDIQDENFGKEVSEPKPPVQIPPVVGFFGLIILACVASIIVSLTIQLDRWIVH